MMYIYLDGIPGLGRNWRLPVNPNADFNISTNNEFETVDVFKLGKVIQKRNQDLQTISWNSYLPIDPDEVRVFSGIDNYSGNPIQQAEALKNAENSIIVLKINIDDTPYISMNVILKSFNTIDRGGNPGDIFYNITLTQYKQPIVSVSNIDPPPPPTDTQVQSNSNTQTSNVKTIRKADKENESLPVGNVFTVGSIVKVYGDGYKMDYGSEATTYRGIENTYTFNLDSRVKNLDGVATVKKILNGRILTYLQDKPSKMVRVRLSTPIKTQSIVDQLKRSFESLLDTFSGKGNTYNEEISDTWIPEDKCKVLNARISSRGI